MALVKLNSNISFGEVIRIYVLGIENLFYVGSSRRLYERVCHHTKSLRMETYKERPLLQEAIIEILEILDGNGILNVG